MPEKKLHLLMPKLSEIILTNSSHANSIIKSIPANQLDAFITKFSQVMTQSEFCNPEIYSEAINSIPKEKTQLLLDNLSNIVISHIINGSGWMEDSPESWRNVKNILNALPQEHRIEMAINTSNKINNTSRRDRLLEIIPEEERELVNKNVTPTTWQAVRATAKAIAETSELIHGNSSIDTPKKKWQDKVSSRKENNEQHKYV